MADEKPKFDAPVEATKAVSGESDDQIPAFVADAEVEARSEQKQESAQAKAVMGTSLNRDGATIAELDAFAGQDQQTADAAAVAEDATHKQFATNAEEKKTSLSASESHNYGPQLVTAFQSAGAKLAGIAVGIGRAAIYGPVIVLSTIALFVFFGDRILAFSSHLLNGPQGTVYLSSPGVYTRERLVNDRNDQDYWLRNQLTVLDKFNLEYSELSKTKRALSSADKRRTPDTLGDPSSDANLLMNEGMSPGALVAPNLVDTPKREETGIDDVPTLSFIDTFTIRSAARDAIRQAMLENLLDDRHDLTGNSVYGLRFDTSVFPGKYTSGRAYVHLTVRIKNDQLGSKEQLLNGGVPLHVASYYNHPARDLERNEGNPFYNSRQLYKRWLDNVKWRLDTYFQELAEKKCQCDVDACKIDNWEQEIITSVSDVLAMSGASINSQDFPSVPSKDEAFRLVTLDLPDPWENLLRINVANYYSSNCGLLPSFDVLEVRDIVFILEKKTRRPEYYALAEYSDTEELFVFQPKKAENNKKKGYSEVHYQPYEIAQFLYNNKKKLSCFENKRFNSCDKYIDVPAGYFNFIEKVIDTDMFAYSIFPRMDGTAVFSKANENFGLGATLPSTESTFSLDLDHTSSSNRVEPTFVGFADSEAKGTIEFGWVIEIPRAGQAFQKSQFALISVPAWTSQLEITAEVGWLENSTGKRLKSKEPYKFEVPLPPEYESFDAFISGKEAVRRPKISRRLIDETFFTPCARNVLLIPGYRLWRSAAVTVGSQSADKITVLPNMKGIIAEFPPSRSASTSFQPLRVWTSEGVDTVRDIVRYSDNVEVESCRSASSPSAKVTQAEDVRPDASVAFPVQSSTANQTNSEYQSIQKGNVEGE